MKNKIIYIFKSKIKLKIEGRNIERFIKRLVSNKIELLDIKYSKYNNIEVIIYTKDYKKVTELKSIYNLTVIDSYGFIKIRKKIKLNTVFLTSILFGFGLLLFLTNVIFDIEVVYSNKEVRSFMIEQLKHRGIKKYQMIKSFDDIEKIKQNILNEYKDKIEWLEIERVGVKYVVRLELREIVEKSKNFTNQNVVASKESIIKEVDAYSGEIVRKTNDFVRKGDVIISGNIMLNDQIKGATKADGIVFAEVWYEVEVEYPFTYYEEKETGKRKTVYSLKLFNYSLDLFNFKPYKRKTIETKTLLSNSLLPIFLTKEVQKEVTIIDEVINEEEAIKKAHDLARNKISDNLDNNEYIITSKILKIDIKDSKVVLNIFISVYENITDYQEIILENIETR